MSRNFKIAISMGCPAGIGPEIILKSLPFFSEYFSNLLIIGDKKVLKTTADRLGVPYPEKVEVLSLSELDITPGNPTLEGYRAMASYFQKAIELAKKGEVQGIVTAPISKEGLAKAGIPFSGHTSWLVKEFNTEDYVMCFYGEKLIVSLVTIHIPLKKVPESLSEEKIVKVCRLSCSFLRKIGKEGKIAVCGVNPHAGESGLLGDEEINIIEKAVKRCAKMGLPVEGPFPADTIFYWAYRGEYALVVAMYHDQGLAPFKLLHFEDGVNITLGLPIVRTSPCHGTAYNIAGKGIANPGSFTSALKLAIKLLSC